MKKCGQNAYEIQLPPNLGLSPIFNVCDLTPYKGNGNEEEDPMQVAADDDIPKHDPPKLRKVLDTRVIKRIRNKEYKEYLVAWQGKPNFEEVWMKENQISNHGADLQTRISSGLEISSPREYSVGESLQQAIHASKDEY